MKIAAIILLLLLLYLLVSLLSSLYTITWSLDSPLIPHSLLVSLTQSTLMYATATFVFWGASLFFAIKRKFKISIFISGSYILLYFIAVYVFDFIGFPK